MRYLADLHIHSRYSRACSRDLSPETLALWGQLKGISVIGTGDFTHPLWLEELADKLEPTEGGLLALRKELALPVPESCRAPVYFIPSAEISCIYRKNDRTRKVHLVVIMPGLSEARRLNDRLARIGNLKSDGRPILGLDAKNLLAMTLEVSPEALVIPAHAWTPHFSVFGAYSGFDSLEECFDDLTPHIHAIETGLSSDPAMNRRISALDRIALISSSDAHSPAKLGREATILDTEPTAAGLLNGIRSGTGVKGTIEFFPEEGKYHVDGHRDCGFSCLPTETVARDFLCPSCGKKLTVGVLHRVENLADRSEGHGPPTVFVSAIPLVEILSEVLGKGPATKTVQSVYSKMLESLGNEFFILFDASAPDIAAATSHAVASAIMKVRLGEVQLFPGFDGQFGSVKIPL